MNREEVFTKLNEVFQDVFDDETICLTDESKASDIQDWDSLEFVNIIVAVMQTFNIKFSIEDLRKLKNIGQMVDLILQRLNHG